SRFRRALRGRRSSLSRPSNSPTPRESAGMGDSAFGPKKAPSTFRTSRLPRSLPTSSSTRSARGWRGGRSVWVSLCIPRIRSPSTQARADVEAFQHGDPAFGPPALAELPALGLRLDAALGLAWPRTQEELAIPHGHVLR